MRRSPALRHLFVAALLVPVSASTATGQGAPPDSSWDVTKARGKTRAIDFSTSEGTWTSVDVSPDGTWIAFDLLGHIYRMPIGGGPRCA